MTLRLFTIFCTRQYVFKNKANNIVFRRIGLLPISRSISSKIDEKYELLRKGMHIFFLKVHPDLYAAQSQEIKHENQECFKMVKEILGVAECIAKSKESSRQKILQRTYTTTFFYRPQQNPEETLDRAPVEKAEVVLSFPPPPTQMAMTSSHLLTEISSQMGKLLNSIGFEEEAKELGARMAGPKSQTEFQAEEEKYFKAQGLSMEESKRIVDQDLMKIPLVTQAERKRQRRRGFQIYAPSKHLENVDTLYASDSDWIEAYIHSGRVITQNVSSLSEEMKVITQLTKCIHSFQKVYRTDKNDWRSIYFVLNGNLSKIRVRKYQTKKIVFVPKKFRSLNLVNELLNVFLL